MERPAEVHLSREDSEALIEHLHNDALTTHDRWVLEQVLRWHVWLLFALQEARFSLKRLRAMVFGDRAKQRPPKPSSGSGSAREGGAEGLEAVSVEAMKTVVVLLLALLAQAGGNVCLSTGMRALEVPSQLGGPAIVSLLLRGLTHPTLWLGIGLSGVFFGLYAAALSWADLSVVLPATALGYVLNVACGAYILHEAVTPARWAGAVLIGLGLCCVSWSVRCPALPGSTRGDPCRPC